MFQLCLEVLKHLFLLSKFEIVKKKKYIFCVKKMRIDVGVNV